MKIKIIKSGPYLVTGNVPLSKIEFVIDENNSPICFGKKERIETSETYSLCRCGHSNNKPFCDGNHGKIGFKGEEIASKNLADLKNNDIETDKVKLIDRTIFCDHSRFCLREGGIRKLIDDGTEESIEIAIEEAKNCPSGRLTLINKENNESSESEYEREIIMIYDSGEKVQGPIWVRGGIEIESSNGDNYDIRNRITLCQCGKSENKPFCNGSHWVSQERQAKFRKKWGLD
ncbi:iron-binding zinc finger CDGSH type [Methanobrevibacter filiformis]|uniref:Iron-binding zinc finger CDGSH type n=1 Tax=Methanobrevibacter filiformis TaxID=55758 RepID=A0A165Z624_9EURY|nr:iron-binding zinc finger CDGSH type [Methanobrevibacter filiformis]